MSGLSQVLQVESHILPQQMALYMLEMTHGTTLEMRMSQDLIVVGEVFVLVQYVVSP